MTEKLFTPDTLQDGYEDALQRGMDKLSIKYTVEHRIMLLRNALPDVYMRLCYIAYDCRERGNWMALKDAINIFVSCYQHTSALQGIRDAIVPRYILREVNEPGLQGWHVFDTVFNKGISPVTDKEKAQAWLDEQHRIEQALKRGD